MLALLVVSSAAMAAEGDGSTLPMSSITVIGVAPLPGLGVERDKLPYSVQSLSAHDMQGAGALTLSESLVRRFAGVNASDLQGNSFLPEVTFHGYRASSLLGAPQGVSVFLDGVRINEAFGGVVSWDLIPEAALERALLITGSNPVYGLNTLGGALALTTRSGLTSPGATFDVKAGSFGRERADITFGWHDDSGRHAFVAATAFGEDGWRDHSPGHLGNAFVKVGRADGLDAWEATVLAARSSLTGNGLLPSFHLADAGRTPGLYDDDRRVVYTWPDRATSRVLQGTVRGTHRFDAESALTLQLFHRVARRETVSGDVDESYARYVEDCANGFGLDGEPVSAGCSLMAGQGASLPPAVINTTTTRQTSSGIAGTWSMHAGAHRFAVGGDVQHGRVRYEQFQQSAGFTADREASAYPAAPITLFSGVSGRSLAAGAYATDTWSIAPTVHVTGSLRYSSSRVSNRLETGEGDPTADDAFAYRKLNPALGLAQQFGSGLTLFGGYSQSTRVPTAIELGCANPVEPCRLPAGLQSDPFLAQVVARTIEAGLRARSWPEGQLTLSVFRTRNQDDILFLRAPQTQQGYFANFPRTRNQGVDVIFEQRLGSVSLHASYSYLDATYDASGRIVSGERTIDATRGMRLAGLPRNTLRAAIDWAAGAGVTLGADVFAASRLATVGHEDGLRADAVAGEKARTADASVGGYALLNLRASWRPERRLELYATVGNALGKRYETYGALGDDFFPNGTLLAPHLAPGDAATARFVAPGGPLAFLLGLRYTP